jgi:hypothetical protein
MVASFFNTAVSESSNAPIFKTLHHTRLASRYQASHVAHRLPTIVLLANEHIIPSRPLNQEHSITCRQEHASQPNRIEHGYSFKANVRRIYIMLLFQLHHGRTP